MFPRETTCHLCWGTLAFVHLLLFVTPYLGPVFLTPSCHSLLLGLSPVLILPRLTSSRILWTQLHLLPSHGQSPHSPPTPISSSGPNWNWFPTARLIESEHMKISLQHETFQYLHRSLSRISFSCVYSPDHQNREVEHHQKPPSWVQIPEYSVAVPLSFYLPTRISRTIVRGLAEVHTSYVYYCSIYNCLDAITGYQNAKNTTRRSWNGLLKIHV